MTVTKDEAAWIVRETQTYIKLKSQADDAEYARRARKRLLATRRQWSSAEGRQVDMPLCTDPWEIAVLERQILRYVLEYGYFPSEDIVKTLKASAAEAKRPAAEIRQAQTVLTKKAA